jgi:hypothetical protein
VVEGDYVDFELKTGHFLGFAPWPQPTTVGRIDDVIANREIQTALAHHETSSMSLRVRPRVARLVARADEALPRKTLAAATTVERIFDL